MREVIVVGGGAGGMMAAIFAARGGARVTLLERNEKLGKKVYITGKGRCNVTNDCTLDEFLQQVPRNPRFLYSALSAFMPQDMMALLEQNGCPVVVERGRRVFPASQKASDVTRTLARLLRESGVAVRLNARVRALDARDGRVCGVTLESGETLPADAVILATGGRSYPMTGSDGDGYALAASVGHTIVPQRGVLSAIETDAEWPRSLAGLSLRNVTMTLRQGKRVLWQELGEMLFTHTGISGPLTLTLSCHLPDDWAKARAELDLKPGLTAEQLDARLQRELEAAPRRRLDNVLPALLPGHLAVLLPTLCGVDGGKPCCQLTRTERAALGATMKALPLPLSRLSPLEEAVVTRGGVSVREVNPGTMASKLLPGLFFAGEVLDVDAHTGGYNLQIAWSTGAAAGRGAASFT